MYTYICRYVYSTHLPFVYKHTVFVITATGDIEKGDIDKGDIDCLNGYGRYRIMFIVHFNYYVLSLLLPPDDPPISIKGLRRLRRRLRLLCRSLRLHLMCIINIIMIIIIIVIIIIIISSSSITSTIVSSIVISVNIIDITISVSIT